MVAKTTLVVAYGSTLRISLPIRTDRPPPQGRTVRAGAALPPPGDTHQLNSVNIGMDSYPGRIAIPAPRKEMLPGLVAEGIVMNSRRRHTSRWDSVERVMRLLASAASAAGGFSELINSLCRLR